MEEQRKNETIPKPPLIKRIKWVWVFFAITTAALLTLSIIYPAKGKIAGKATWSYLKEMIFIFPAVLIAMGLFMVWVNRQTVIKYLGESSGPTGLLLAIALGTLPTGPLYVAFPIALMLLKKGARTANVMAFLCSWAAMSIPAELMEFRFLGWKFTLLRFGLTFVLIIPMCLFAEWLYKRWGGPAELQAVSDPNTA